MNENIEEKASKKLLKKRRKKLQIRASKRVAFPVQTVAFTVETRGKKCNGYCDDCV